MVSRSDDIYSPTSYETPGPIIGALGGNVLSQFRVEIDYPEQLLFLERPTERKRMTSIRSASCWTPTLQGNSLCAQCLPLHQA
jgi:hypothetical protein